VQRAAPQYKAGGGGRDRGEQTVVEEGSGADGGADLPPITENSENNNRSLSPELRRGEVSSSHLFEGTFFYICG
jgi:hypothetical protein